MLKRIILITIFIFTTYTLFAQQKEYKIFKDTLKESKTSVSYNLDGQYSHVEFTVKFIDTVIFAPDTLYTFSIGKSGDTSLIVPINLNQGQKGEKQTSFVSHITKSVYILDNSTNKYFYTYSITDIIPFTLNFQLYNSIWLNSEEEKCIRKVLVILKAFK